MGAGKNSTAPGGCAFSFNWVHDCKETGCLFNLSEDPTEHVDKAAIMPTVAADMLKKIRALNLTTFSPYRFDIRFARLPLVSRTFGQTFTKFGRSLACTLCSGPGEQNKDVNAACTAAVEKYGGFFGPYVFDSDEEAGGTGI